MKRLISLFLCLGFIIFPCSIYGEIIEDEFANLTLDKNLSINIKKQKPLIDDFALETLDSNLKIQKRFIKPIYDDFALETLDSNLKILKHEQNFKHFENINRFLIKVSPVEYLSTKNNIQEGQYINFRVIQDVNDETIKIKKGTFISARVETVSKNDIYGIPADMIIDNFVIDNKYKLSGQLRIVGAKRYFWIYPLKYILGSLFYAGFVVMPIRGGHAKLKPNKIYEIYFEVE